MNKKFLFYNNVNKSAVRLFKFPHKLRSNSYISVLTLIYSIMRHDSARNNKHFQHIKISRNSFFRQQEKLKRHGSPASKITENEE